MPLLLRQGDEFLPVDVPLFAMYTLPKALALAADVVFKNTATDAKFHALPEVKDFGETWEAMSVDVETARGALTVAQDHVKEVENDPKLGSRLRTTRLDDAKGVVDSADALLKKRVAALEGLVVDLKKFHADWVSRGQRGAG